MPDFEQIIKRFQQLASTRGGAVLTIVVLISTAVFATGLIVLTAKIIEPLPDIWRTSFTIFMFVYFMLLALVIYKFIRLRTSAEPESVNGIRNIDASDKQKSYSIKGYNFKKLSGCIVIIGILLIGILVYAFAGFMIIKDMLIPTIQNISTTQFEWDVKYLGENIIIPLMIIVVWIIMPFVLYLESKRTKGKRK